MKINGKNQQDIDIKEAIENGQVVICLEDQIGAIIHQNKVINFNFDEIEDTEDMMNIISKATQESFGLHVPQGCCAYKYSIHNDGEYDFASETSVYHAKFFSDEEFANMVQEAIDDGCDDEYRIASWLENNKGFFYMYVSQSICVDRPWRKEHEHLENEFQILYR